VDNGVDADRVVSTNSWEGTRSVRLKDNSGTNSAMTSPGFNLSTATGFKIEFYFKATGFETAEDFWIQYKSATGNWTTIGTIIQGTHFNNNSFYLATATVPGFTPTTLGKFRIQCDASDDTDQVYVDQVIIKKITGSQLIEETMSITEVLEIPFKPIDQNDVVKLESPVVYPNPANDELNISFQGDIQSIKLMSLSGVAYKVNLQSAEDKRMNVQELAPGMYFLWIQSGDEWYPLKFTKL